MRVMVQGAMSIIRILKDPLSEIWLVEDGRMGFQEDIFSVLMKILCLELATKILVSLFIF